MCPDYESSRLGCEPVSYMMTQLIHVLSIHRYRGQGTNAPISDCCINLYFAAFFFRFIHFSPFLAMKSAKDSHFHLRYLWKCKKKELKKKIEKIVPCSFFEQMKGCSPFKNERKKREFVCTSPRLSFIQVKI